jgi:hypothetical protein
MVIVFSHTVQYDLYLMNMLRSPTHLSTIPSLCDKKWQENMNPYSSLLPPQLRSTNGSATIAAVTTAFSCPYLFHAT